MAKKYDYTISVGLDDKSIEEAFNKLKKDTNDKYNVTININYKEVDKDFGYIKKQISEINNQNIFLKLDQSELIKQLNFLENNINGSDVGKKFSKEFVNSITKAKLDDVLKKVLGDGVTRSKDNINKLIQQLSDNIIKFDIGKSNFEQIQEYANSLNYMKKVISEISTGQYSKYVRDIEFPDIYKNFDYKSMYNELIANLKGQSQRLIVEIQDEQKRVVEVFNNKIGGTSPPMSEEIEKSVNGLDSFYKGLQKTYGSADEVLDVMKKVSDEIDNLDSVDEDKYIKLLAVLEKLDFLYNELEGDGKKYTSGIKKNLDSVGEYFNNQADEEKYTSIANSLEKLYSEESKTTESLEKSATAIRDVSQSAEIASESTKTLTQSTGIVNEAVKELASNSGTLIGDIKQINEAFENSQRLDSYVTNINTLSTSFGDLPLKIDATASSLDRFNERFIDITAKTNGYKELSESLKSENTSNGNSLLDSFSKNFQIFIDENSKVIKEFSELFFSKFDSISDNVKRISDLLNNGISVIKEVENVVETAKKIDDITEDTSGKVKEIKENVEQVTDSIKNVNTVVEENIYEEKQDSSVLEEKNKVIEDQVREVEKLIEAEETLSNIDIYKNQLSKLKDTSKYLHDLSEQKTKEYELLRTYIDKINNSKNFDPYEAGMVSLEKYSNAKFKAEQFDASLYSKKEAKTILASLKEEEEHYWNSAVIYLGKYLSGLDAAERKSAEIFYDKKNIANDIQEAYNSILDVLGKFNGKSDSEILNDITEVNKAAHNTDNEIKLIQHKINELKKEEELHQQIKAEQKANNESLEQEADILLNNILNAFDTVESKAKNTDAVIKEISKDISTIQEPIISNNVSKDIVDGLNTKLESTVKDSSKDYIQILDVDKNKSDVKALFDYIDDRIIALHKDLKNLQIVIEQTFAKPLEKELVILDVEKNKALADAVFINLNNKIEALENRFSGFSAVIKNALETNFDNTNFKNYLDSNKTTSTTITKDIVNDFESIIKKATELNNEFSNVKRKLEIISDEIKNIDTTNIKVDVASFTPLQDSLVSCTDSVTIFLDALDKVKNTIRDITRSGSTGFSNLSEAIANTEKEAKKAKQNRLNEEEKKYVDEIDAHNRKVKENYQDLIKYEKEYQKLVTNLNRNNFQENRYQELKKILEEEPYADKYQIIEGFGVNQKLIDSALKAKTNFNKNTFAYYSSINDTLIEQQSVLEKMIGSDKYTKRFTDNIKNLFNEYKNYDLSSDDSDLFTILFDDFKKLESLANDPKNIGGSSVQTQLNNLYNTILKFKDSGNIVSQVAHSIDSLLNRISKIKDASKDDLDYFKNAFSNYKNINDKLVSQNAPILQQQREAEKAYLQDINEHNNQVISNYQKLLKTQKEYINLLNKDRKQLNSYESERLDYLRNERELFYNGADKYNPLYNTNANDRIYKQAIKIKELFENVNFDKILPDFNNKIESASKKLNKLFNSDSFTDRFKSEIDDLYKEFKTFDLVEGDLKELILLFEKYDNIINQVNNDANKGGISVKRNLAELQYNIAKFIADNTKMSNELRESFSNLAKEMANNNDPSAAQREDYRTRFKELQELAVSTGQTGDSVLTKLKKSIQSANMQFISMYLSLNDFIRYGQEMFNVLKNLDYELVDLRKTSSMSTKELNDFYLASSSIAKEMGITTSGVITLASSWSRLGFDTKQAATELTKLSAQFAGISPEMNLEDAQDGLIAVMKAFGYDVSEVKRQILDNINEIGNTMAVDNNDIVEGLKRSASAMSVANNSLEQTIALLTAGTEITRDAESMGAALKTISMRIRGYDEETGELIDNVEELHGKIADLTKTASSPGGISLFTDKSKQTYKSTYQILKEISEIWDELTDKNKAQLLERLFAKTRANQGAAIISNFKSAEKAMANMLNASGSADREMENIKQSITYKLNALSATWTGILQNLVSRGLITNIIDGLVKISDGISAISKSGIGISSIIAGITSLSGQLTGFGIKYDKVTNQITVFGHSLKDLKNIFHQTKTDYKDLVDNFNNAKIQIDNGKIDYSNSFFSTEQGKLVKSYFNAVESGAVQGEKSIQGYISYVEKAKFSLKAFGQTLLAIGSQFAITFAIGAVISIINDFITANERLQQSVKEVGEELNNNTTEIDDYKEKIQSLYDKLNDENTSYAESKEIRSELLSIQDKLIEKYGDEASAIASINSAIDGHVDALDSLRKKQYEIAKSKINSTDLIVDFTSNLEGYSSNFDKVISKMSSKEEVLLDTSYKDSFYKQTDEYKKAIDEFVKSGYLKKDYLGFKDSFAFVGDNLEDIYNKAVKVYNKLSEINPKDNFTKELGRRITEMGNVIDAYGNIYDEYIYQGMMSDININASINQLKKSRDKYKEAYINGNASDIEEAETEFLTALNNAFDKAGNQLYKNKIREMFSDMEKIIKQNDLKIDIDSGNISDVIRDFNVFSSDYQKLEGHVSSMSEAEKGAYLRLNEAADKYGMTIQELFEILYNSKKIMSAFNSKELYSIFNKYNSDIKNLGYNFVQSFNEFSLREQEQILSWSEDQWNMFNQNVKNYIENGETSVDAVKRSILDVMTYVESVTKEKINTTSKAVKDVSEQMSKEFDALGSIYQKIFYDSEGKDVFDLSNLDVKDLESIRSSFGEVNKTLEELGASAPIDTLNDFLNILADSSSSADDVHEAFNNLADAYLRSIYVLQDVNGETKNAIVQMFEQMGIVNAEIVAFTSLISVQEDLVTGQKQLIVDGINLTNANYDVLQSFVEERVSAENLKQALALLQIQQLLVNDTLINTEYSQAQLEALAKMAGIATTALTELARVQNKISDIKTKMSNYDPASKEAMEAMVEIDKLSEEEKNLKTKIQEDINQVKYNPKPSVSTKNTKKDKSGGGTGSRNGGGSSKDKSSSEVKNEYKEEIDKLIADLKDASERGAETIRTIKDDFLAKGFVWNEADNLLVDNYFSNLNKLITENHIDKNYKFGQGGNEILDALEESIKEAANLAGVTVEDFLDIYSDAHRKMKYTTADYLEDMKRLVDSAYKQGKISLDEYMDYVRTYLKEYKAMLESVESGVEKYLDFLIKPLEDEKDRLGKVNDGYDEKITKLKEAKEEAEKAYDAELNALDDLINKLKEQKEALEDEKERITKYYESLIKPIQDQIDALQEANQEREEAIKLEKDFYNLQRAINQRTQLVYTEQGFQYRANQQAIRDAREQLEADEYAAKIDDLEDKIKELEKAQEAALKPIEDQIDAIDKQIAAIEKQKDALEKKKEEALKGYELEIEAIEKHKDAIDEQTKAIDEQIDAIRKYKEEWQRMMELQEFSTVKPLLDKMLPENWEERLQQLDPEMIQLFSQAYSKALDDMGTANDDINVSMSKLGSTLPNAPIFTELVPSINSVNNSLGIALGNIDLTIGSSLDSIQESINGIDIISGTLEEEVPSIESASDLIGETLSGTAPRIDSATDLIRESLNGTVTVVNEAVSEIKSALAGDVISSTVTTTTSATSSSNSTGGNIDSTTTTTTSSGFEMAEVDTKKFEESLNAIKEATELFKEDILDLWTEINDSIASALGIGGEETKESEKGSTSRNSENNTSTNSFLGSFIALTEQLPEPLNDILTLLDAWYEGDEPSIVSITEGVIAQFKKMATAVETSVARIQKAVQALESGEIFHTGGTFYDVQVKEGVAKELGFEKGVKKLATGVKHLAWTQEKGREIIISPSSNAVLTPLSRGDSVLKNSFTENLFDWAALSPNQYLQKVASTLKNFKIEVNQNNTPPTINISDTRFEIVGVTGEDVIRKIESQFDDIIVNAYQRAMS